MSAKKKTGMYTKGHTNHSNLTNIECRSDKWILA